MSRIVVIGSVNLDLFTHVERHPKPGETLAGSSTTQSPGGKGANQALAARLLGGDVTLVGAVGDDSNSNSALQLLSDAGVDLRYVKRISGSTTGLAVITVSKDGENTIVYVAGANLMVSPSEAESALKHFNEGDLLVLQGELSRETTEYAARFAINKGMRVVLNVAPWGNLDRDVLLSADPLVLNEHEIRLASESLFEEYTSDLTELELAQKIINQGAPSVIVTLGSRGALVAGPDGTHLVRAKETTTVDTTGAGDAFVGALVARLAAGDDLSTATKTGNLVGAWVVSRHGAQPSYPTMEDVFDEESRNS